MQPTEPNHFARKLFERLPPHYDALAALLSFGQDRRWRRAVVDAVAAAPAAVALDVATGPAGVALAVARRTGGWVAGIDLTPQMLTRAAANVRQSPYGRQVALVLGRAEELPFPDASFDALTFSYLLRYVADPEATLSEMARVTKPGGVIASLEFHPPPKGPWHALWLVYTRVVLPAAGYALGGRQWWDVGRFLGPSISGYYRRYPLAWHEPAWRRAGVEDVTIRLMSKGGGLVMSGRKCSGRG
jgi:demethylmenaquinone methyltransferase/2-methoxy-6-polyprenyl-1,4-benzoquinol methylase